MKLQHVIILIFTLTLLSIAVLVSLNIHGQKKERILVLNKIEQLQQLVTAKQIYREVIYSKETKDFLWIPLKNKEFLFALDYIITAGIDISKGFKVEDRDGYKLITLPRAEIFSIDADDTSIKEYFIKQRFSKLNRDDYFQLIKESKLSILSGNSINTLLIESEVNAKTLLKSLLQVSDIIVEVEFSNKVIKVLK